MLSTVVLFVTLQVSPTPIVQYVQGFTNVENCEAVIKAVKRDELANPVEPLIGNKLQCVTVVYQPPENKTSDGEPKSEPVIHCKSRKNYAGRELSCKDA